jgi:DNA-binding transcriptional regulator LsrR (DeoR family)
MVAGGASKHKIIQAAVTGRWVDRLVTDTSTAAFLLEGGPTPRSSSWSRPVD